MSSSVDASIQTVQSLMMDPERTKPKFIESTNVDGLVAAVLRLTMEVSTLRDRLDIQEAIAERHGVGGEAEVEAFRADAALNEKRADRRQRLVESIIHDLTAVG